MAKNKFIVESLGALPFKIDVRDYKFRTKEDAELPESFELEAPKVKNQQSTCSCVAHSIAEVNEYFNKMQEKNDKAMSTGFIYGNRRNSIIKSSGMFVREALRNTCKYGNVYKDDFKENVEVPEAIDLFEARFDKLKDKAYPNRISTYFRLRSHEDIKRSLMEYGPVVFAMYWYAGITVDGDGVMHVDTKAKKTGGHCMIIYGWNEKGWLIQNSWGTYWGKKGRAILPYDVKIREAWGVTDEVTLENSDIKKSIFNNTTILRFIAKVLNKILNFFRKE